jgi:RNA polymerase sigma factor (sigma-70 family)
MTGQEPSEHLLEQAASANPDESQPARFALMEERRSFLVRAVARRLPRHLRDLAEDLVQAAFAVAVPKLDALEWRGLPKFHGWLWQLVRRQFRDWCKHVRRLKCDYRRLLRPSTVEADGSDTDPLAQAARDSDTPSRLLARREREDRLHAAMDRVLKPRECRALRLRYFEHLPVADVAVLLKCSPAAVKMRCQRALEKLRQALGSASDFFSSR